MYSMDLRQRVVRAVADGQGCPEVAKRFDVSIWSVRNWCARAEQGRLEPDKTGPKGSRKFTAADDALLTQAVKRDPGVTAGEVQPLLSQSVSINAICERWKRLGLRLKKSR